MPIVIQPYREEHEGAVQAFNQRLRAASSDPNLVFYERSEPAWLPPLEGSPICNRYFVVLENGFVRGAYALKFEQFFVLGRGELAVACYHHPLSEGVIDRRYATVGGLMLRDAVQREPMLYALGMDGMEQPLARMLHALGWSMRLVPFYFHVVHPYKFLREMKALRQSVLMRWAMDLGAFTGTGFLAIEATQRAKRRSETDRVFEMAEVDEFPKWADPLWIEGRESYGMASVRDWKTISRLYPATDKGLTKLCVTRSGSPIGWAIVGERRKDAKFGTLRVGSIIDCWAQPQNALAVIRAATDTLRSQGMDLIVSNQGHNQWCRALAQSGFLQAKSNFVFAASKQLSRLLRQDFSTCHINRANGDGLPHNF